MNSSFSAYQSGFKVTIPPGEEPITLEEVKAQTKVETTADDTIINLYIQAARSFVEKYMGMALVTQTIREKRSIFPLVSRNNPKAAIYLKRYPLQEVTEIKYKDSDGAEVTLDGSLYKYDEDVNPPVIMPANNQSWPDIYDELSAVTITYTAGFGDRVHVPADIKQSLLLIVADWYDNRENAVYEKETAAHHILNNRRGVII